jgi:hypothetical protein
MNLVKETLYEFERSDNSLKNLGIGYKALMSQLIEMLKESPYFKFTDPEIEDDVLKIVTSDTFRYEGKQFKFKDSGITYDFEIVFGFYLDYKTKKMKVKFTVDNEQIKNFVYVDMFEESFYPDDPLNTVNEMELYYVDIMSPENRWKYMKEASRYI